MKYNFFLFHMNRYYNKTGAEIIRLFLNEKGVKNVFGFTGAVLSLTDQFHSSHKSGIKHITNRTEAQQVIRQRVMLVLQVN